MIFLLFSEYVCNAKYVINIYVLHDMYPRTFISCNETGFDCIIIPSMLLVLRTFESYGCLVTCITSHNMLVLISIMVVTSSWTFSFRDTFELYFSISIRSSFLGFSCILLTFWRKLSQIISLLINDLLSSWVSMSFAIDLV